MTHRVLIVDDDADLTALVSTGLEAHGFETWAECDPAAGLVRLGDEHFDVVLVDVRMPKMSGLEFCRQATEVRPGLPVLIMTAFASLETAVEAIRAGAYDYLEKPLSPDAVGHRLRRVVEEAELRREVVRLRRMVERRDGFEELLGESDAMCRLFSQLQRVATSEVAVLLTGESGTGKELAARALHEKSGRADGPFVAVNCAAIPDRLIESELFGHKKGAFTDASADRAGLFVAAAGGTLFLDEVGELPVELQPKLLRALEERRVRPVGSEAEVDVDFRLLTATNRDLETAIAEGSFREDLFYRVNVVHVEMPPLRARGRDVLLLAQRFLENAPQSARVDGLDASAAERLLSYSWPGNVRELRNAMEHAVALARHDKITVQDLPSRIRDFRPSHVLVSGTVPDELVTLEEVERRYISHVLGASNGNKSAAARILGLDRRTLHRKLAAWEEADDGGGD